MVLSTLKFGVLSVLEFRRSWDEYFIFFLQLYLYKFDSLDCVYFGMYPRLRDGSEEHLRRIDTNCIIQRVFESMNDRVDHWKGWGKNPWGNHHVAPPSNPPLPRLDGSPTAESTEDTDTSENTHNCSEIRMNIDRYQYTLKMMYQIILNAKSISHFTNLSDFCKKLTV